MKERTKSTLSNAFGSLINNDKAIASAKEAPLWLTIVIFFLAIILPIIPITVANGRSYGSSFISTYSYGTEKTLPMMALEMAKDGKTLTINENHELGLTTNDLDPEYKYVNSITNQTEMEIYFSAANTKEAQNAFLNSVKEHKFVLKEANETEGTETTYYHSSYVVFFNNGLYASIYAPNSMDVISYSALGDFKAYEPGTNLIEALVKLDEQTSITSDADIIAIMSDAAKTEAIFNNWKTLFNKTYYTARDRATWLGSLVYLGVYAGLTLIMGFLIWILTRGKNNPFNYLSLWICLKIEAWASLCPGLIGLLLGFLLPQYAVMVFIMTVGMRTMWLAMKQLRPQVQ